MQDFFFESRVSSRVLVVCCRWSKSIRCRFASTYHPWYWQAALKIRDEEEGSTARSSPAEETKAKAKPAMAAGQDAATPQVLTLRAIRTQPC